MDAAVQAQRGPPGRQLGFAKIAHQGVQIERGFGGAAAIAFTRVGQPEHRQHAVALDAHHTTAMPGDHRLVDAPKMTEHVGVVLGLRR